VFIVNLQNYLRSQVRLSYVRVFLIGFMLAIPTASHSQYDLIAIFADSTHSDCAVTFSCVDEDCGWIFFWFFHYSTSGAFGSRFKAPHQDCFLEQDFAGAFRPFPGTTGTTEFGITIPYGSCRSGWTHILTVGFWAGLPGVLPCCEYPVLPHPSSTTGDVEIMDCTGNWVSADKTSAFIEADASCPCSIATGILDRATTWGAVKALYRSE
jgi:hypothetical protein